MRTGGQLKARREGRHYRNDNKVSSRVWVMPVITWPIEDDVENKCIKGEREEMPSFFLLKDKTQLNF